MNKLKLKYVKILFKDGNIVVFADEGNIDHIAVLANSYSETNVTVTVIYNNSQNEVRHDEDRVYKTEDIKEIVQRWS